MGYKPLKRACCGAGCINPKIPESFKADWRGLGFLGHWVSFAGLWRLDFVEQVFNPPLLQCYWRVPDDLVPLPFWSLLILKYYTAASQDVIRWDVVLTLSPCTLTYAREWPSNAAPCQTVNELFLQGSTGGCPETVPPDVSFEPWTFADG